MRVLDDNKKKAIGKAAIHLINTIGFAETSMSKIAKLAKVSPATIYTYFDNKEDMLNKLYLMTKGEFAATLNENFSPDMDVREGIRVLFNNIIVSFQKNPDFFIFKEQFANSPLVHKISEKMVEESFGTIFAFFARAKNTKIIKDIPNDMISIFLYHPIVSFLKTKNNEQKKVTKKEKDLIFEMTWNAIVK